MAERRVPRSVFDYLDGGADAEVTLAENCRAFRDTTFRPRSGIAIYDCKTIRERARPGNLFPCHPCSR